MTRGLKHIAAGLLKDPLLLILLAALGVLTAVNPGKLGTYPSLVNWPTIAALTGLLVLTKGLESSGSLHLWVPG